MMDYEEFSERIIAELKKEYDAEAEITKHEVIKVNGIKLDGISVKLFGMSRPSEAVASPTVYLNDLYENYKNGYGISQIVDNTRDVLSRHIIPHIKIPELTRESARKNLYCVVVNYEKNKEMLKDVPHERIEDLAVIPRFRVGDDGSFLVRNSVCEALMMTPEEVMEFAHTNTDKEVYSCQSLNEVLFGLMSESGLSEEFMDDVMTEGQECMMYVLTNERKCDGAVAISSPKALKDAFEKIGPYIIICSSRHELLLIPDKMVTDIRDIESMVRDVNQNSVSEEDFLSNTCYHFDGIILTRADVPAEIMGETMTEAFEKILADAPVLTHAHAH